MLQTQAKRDRRIKVKIPVRLRGDGPDRDAFILDLSARGMLGSCPQPPPRGAFVELIIGNQSFVGHVKWAVGNGRFGLVLQERIDVDAFEAGGPLRVATGTRRASPVASPAGSRPTAGPAGFGRAGADRTIGAGPKPLPIAEVEIPTTSADDDKRAKMMVLMVVGGLLAVAVLIKLAMGLL